MRDAILIELLETWEISAAMDTEAPPAKRETLRMCADTLRMMIDSQAACGDPRRHLTAEDCARLLPKSKAEAIAFLKRVGILTEDGGLSPRYYSAEEIEARSAKTKTFDEAVAGLRGECRHAWETTHSGATFKRAKCKHCGEFKEWSWD